MDEDTDDKIRRNLVLTSTAVLLGAWLNLPAQTIVKRVFGDDAGNAVQAWRVWMAALAMLVYLALRYKFSHGAKLAWAVAKGELQTMRLSAIKAAVEGEARNFTRTGKEPDAFKDELAAYVIKRVGPDQLSRPVIEFRTFTHHGSGRTGEATVSLIWPAESLSDTNNEPLGFELSRGKTLIANTGALLRFACFSNSSTSFIVPVALAGVAIGISLWRLFGSLL